MPYLVPTVSVYNVDFIQRYIFPGGMLPSCEALQETIANAGLKISNHFAFGASYAETLSRWDTEFQANWAKIEKMGFDERFFRMWRYYLCYCQVGFESLDHEGRESISVQGRRRPRALRRAVADAELAAECGRRHRGRAGVY